MALRSAVPTIKGYFYQFDKTILEIMKLSATGTVAVERVEDIDVDYPGQSQAIQCKHIPSSTYSHSAIREPVTLMLDDHAERLKGKKPLLQYFLYAHFSTANAASVPLTVSTLKDVLTYKKDKQEVLHHKVNAITDAVLQSFIDHFTFEAAADFETQQNAVLTELQNHFNCDLTEADLVYYNNALRVVRDLATNPDEDLRRIDKQSFVGRIDTKTTVFDKWYLQLRGEKEYQFLARKRIEIVKALQGNYERLIYIGTRIQREKQCLIQAADFIELLLRDYYHPGVVLHNTRPLTFVFDVSQGEMQKIKRDVLDKNIAFNDGYEDLAFQPWAFNESPIVNSHVSRGAKTPTLGKSSYRLRLIRSETFSSHKALLQAPRKVLFFAEGDSSIFSQETDTSILPLFARDFEGALKILRKGR